MFRKRTGATGLAAVALFALLSLAGCASSSTGEVASLEGTESESSPEKSKSPSDGGALAFAQCMREHGVDVPDPDPNGRGNVSINIPPDMSQDEVDAAFAACEDLMDGGGEAASADDVALMRKYSACMRENGVKDFPDPGPDGSIRFDASTESDDAAAMSDGFETADKVCSKLLPARAGEGA